MLNTHTHTQTPQVQLSHYMSSLKGFLENQNVSTTNTDMKKTATMLITAQHSMSYATVPNY